MKFRVCCSCRRRKSILQFSFKNKSKGLRTTKCKNCTREYGKRHYQNNKDIYCARARKRNPLAEEIYKKNIIEYLSKHPCVDCGNSDVRVLEFDHIKDKRYKISHMRTYSWQTILKEIDRCELRCANCHRIKTGERLGSYRITWLA